MNKTCVALYALLTAACGADGATPPADLQVTVAPLELPGLVDACYSLDVTNEAGSLVWQRSGVCASQFGNGAGGDLSYVGTCDATDSTGDTVAWNTVTLRIDGLYRADGADGDTTPDLLTDWQNPCDAPHSPGGCKLNVPCVENADAPVTFNLTIMRSANQGFFDVAVNFDDIFCSAKVDCAYPGANGGPLELVHDPVSGARVQSLVWALACTDGDRSGPPGESTHLYMSEVVLRCGVATYRVDPSGGPGSLYPLGVAPPPGPIVQAMVF